MKEKPIFTSLWGNKAKIEVFYYDKPLKGEHESDRIQLMITPEGGKPRGWIMNVAEAVDMIYGLSKATSMGLEEYGEELSKLRKEINSSISADRNEPTDPYKVIEEVGIIIGNKISDSVDKT